MEKGITQQSVIPTFFSSYYLNTFIIERFINAKEHICYGRRVIQIQNAGFHRYIAYGIVFLFVFSFFSPFTVVSAKTSSQDITITCTFPHPILRKIHIGNTPFDQVDLPGFFNSLRAGEPALPNVGKNILIPSNKKIERIDVISTGTIFLGKGYDVPPGGVVLPTSQDASSIEPMKNVKIYQSENLYPNDVVSVSHIGYSRGYQILTVSIHPIQYQPSTGGLYYHSRIQFVVKTIDAETTRTGLFRGLLKDAHLVQETIANPETLSSYTDNGEKAQPLSSNYDLLILTTDALKSGFIPLADEHNVTGIRTRIKTLSEIGGNTPEDIRAYIKNEYLTNGIEYVLLGGDAEVIPAKGLFFGNYTGGNTVGPSDIYYACLDGTYNYNGNDLWGEPNDGDGGGDVDLLAEVYVGRAPVSTAAEVQHFVEKTITYIESGIASGGKYIGRTVLVGENLEQTSQYGTWGEDSLEELVDGSSAHGYTTVGIPSDTFQIYRLYEREDIWSGSDVMDLINNGVYIVDHLGHGNANMAMKMSSSDADSLINTKTCFIYSQACNVGRFDETDCFAEHITVNTDYGAFAAIMNTREGWYTVNSTNGPSHWFNREFWDAVYNESKSNIEMKRLGVANQDSKEDNLYRINEDYTRWCYYEITLFGDPALLFYDPIPQPVLNIETITSGFGRVHATIKNTGNVDAASIDWNINVNGGFFHLINRSSIGSSSSLKTNDNLTVDSKFIFGMGKISITVTANITGEPSIQRKTTLFVFGSLIFQTPERLQKLIDRFNK